jgi:acetylglutamate kinase
MEKEKLTIVKIGGGLISDEKMLRDTLTHFANIEGSKILVHGGGKKASSLLAELGIHPQMVNGRRITDEQSLEVIVMVYAGLLNKQIVSILQSMEVDAIGLSGADGNSIVAHKREVKEIDYGFAGDIDYVNASFFQQLLNNRLMPVCCPVTHDQHGQLLNTNADTIAAEIAISLASIYNVKLMYCFEHRGVLKDIEVPKSVIPRLNRAEYLIYQEKGIIQKGMLPKLDNAFYAIEHQVDQVFVTNPHNLFHPENSTEICR